MQISKDLDINDKTLYSWLREYKKANNIHIDDRRTTQKTSSKETASTPRAFFTRHILCKRNSIKYAWIKEHKESFSIALICKIFKLNRSAYY